MQQGMPRSRQDLTPKEREDELLKAANGPAGSDRLDVEWATATGFPLSAPPPVGIYEWQKIRQILEKEYPNHDFC
jgi:hypothetical protein